MAGFFSTILQFSPWFFILFILAVHLWWWDAPLRFKIFIQRNIFRLQAKIPQLPPGSVGVPFLGHLPFVLLSSEHDKLGSYSKKMTSKYGEIFCYSLPPLYGRKTIRLNGEEALKWCFSLENRGIVSSWPESTSTLLGPHSVGVLNGSAHKKMRLLLGPVFQTSYLREYVKYIDKIVRNHFNETWSPVEGINNSDKGTRHVNTRDNLKSLTFKIICELVLGLDLKKDHDEVNEVQRLMEVFSKGLFMPTVKFPGNPYFAALDAREKLKGKVLDIVKRRRCCPVGSKNNVMARLLGPLTSSDKGKEKTVYLDDDQIFEQLLVLMFAGSDTTTSSTTFIVKRLTENPSTLRKLRQEHLALMKSSRGENPSGSLKWDDIIGSLPYTDNAIYESLRLNPPLGGGARKADRDLVYKKKYLIPKGYSVSLNFRANDIGFSNRNVFDPGRFEGHDGALKKKAFKPFGGGKRMCLGNRLAIAEMNVVVHHLVLNYTWEKAPKSKEDINYFPIPMPTDGYPIVVSKKKFP